MLEGEIASVHGRDGETAVAVLFTIYISVVDTCPEDFVGLILGDWTRNVSVLGGIGMGPPSGEKGALRC